MLVVKVDLSHLKEFTKENIVPELDKATQQKVAAMKIVNPDYDFHTDPKSYEIKIDGFQFIEYFSSRNTTDYINNCLVNIVISMMTRYL